MMIPSEMPSVTMGENGHGNGNNDGVTSMMKIIMVMVLATIMIMMAMIMMAMIIKGLSTLCFHKMIIICEGEG